MLSCIASRPTYFSSARLSQAAGTLGPSIRRWHRPWSSFSSLGSTAETHQQTAKTSRVNRPELPRHRHEHLARLFILLVLRTKNIDEHIRRGLSSRPFSNVIPCP